MKKANGWTMTSSNDATSGDKTGNIIWQNYRLNDGDFECGF